MTTERTRFLNAPRISNTEPMKDSDFWKWLEVSKKDRFVDAIKEYLAGHGFDITLHVLPEDVLATYKSVYEHFWWCYFHKQEGK